MKEESLVVDACRFVLPKIARSCEWEPRTDTHYQLVLKNSALIAVNAYPGGDPIFCAVRVILLLLSGDRILLFLDSEAQMPSPFPLSIHSFIIPSPPLCLFYMN